MDRTQDRATREALEMRRMLEWFKAQLPRHTLTRWQIRAEPRQPEIQIEGIPPLSMPRSGFLIAGYGECGRCGRYFEITKMGNAVARDEEGIPEKVEEMKRWVEREADEPCWGDVPKVRDNHGPIAVLDGNSHG